MQHLFTAYLQIPQSHPRSFLAPLIRLCKLLALFIENNAMDKDELEIDVSNHQRVPTTWERLTHALLSMVFGFALIQIIFFWLFPGVGIGGLYMFSSAHPMVGFIGDLTNIFMITFVMLCGVFGWFKGKYFTDRLKGYIKWWQFW